MDTESGIPIAEQPVLPLPRPEPKTLKEWIDMPLRSCCFGCCGIPMGVAILAFLDAASGVMNFVVMSVIVTTTEFLDEAMKEMCDKPDLDPAGRSACDTQAATDTLLHWYSEKSSWWMMVDGVFGLIFGIIGLRAVATRRPSLAHAYFVYRAVTAIVGLTVSAVFTVGIMVATDFASPVPSILSYLWSVLLALYFVKVAKSFRDIVREEISGEGVTPGGGYLPISGVETVNVNPRMRHD